jgi:hypothetical protein
MAIVESEENENLEERFGKMFAEICTVKIDKILIRKPGAAGKIDKMILDKRD